MTVRVDRKLESLNHVGWFVVDNDPTHPPPINPPSGGTIVRRFEKSIIAVLFRFDVEPRPFTGMHFGGSDGGIVIYLAYSIANCIVESGGKEV